MAAASKAGNIVRAIELGTRQFLLDCARPEVRQVVLIDGPAVLGWQRWREIDAAHFGSLLRQLMMTLRGVSALHPRDEALIHLLLGASTEAALVCASAEDAPAATRHLVEAFRVLLQGIEAAEPPLRRGARRT